MALLLWPIPVFGLLHAESSALLAFTAYFVAGLSSLEFLGRGQSFVSVLGRQQAALLVPGLLLTVTMLWRPNCAYVDGLLFFLLFPVITIVFAVSIAYLFVAIDLPMRKTLLVIAGILIAVAGSLYDLGYHPQFYTYNHIFGGLLGPIYDEEVAVRDGLYYFRGLTLLWAAVFVLAGKRARDDRTAGGSTIDRRYIGGFALLLTAIVAIYAMAAPLGINATPQHLRNHLDGHVATEHFDIYYVSESLSASELEAVEHEHEFRYQVLAEKLDVRVHERIQSFLYPDADTRAALIGARYTNVAPVWLATPQMHTLLADLDRAFAHELAHVFSREFGLPIIRASLSVGMVEGLAVALEPPRGLPGPHQQASAALLGGSSQEVERAVSSRMSPFGFWTGRGAVSYTTMGSFIAYLLEAYGPDALKAAYAEANFQSAYGKRLDALAREWTDMLRSLPHVEASSGRLVSARFAVPSLFEKTCPHYTPPYRRAYRDAVTFLARRDSVQAFNLVQQSIELEPRYAPALDLWSRLALVNGGEDDVLERLRSVTPDTMTAGLYVRLGDALALRGDSTEARIAYETALRRLPSYAHEDRSRLALRIFGASRPSTIRMLVGGKPGPEEEQEAPSIWARALVHARLERFELAAYLLRTTPMSPEFRTGALFTSEFESADLDALRRRGLVWLARFTYRSGAPSTAALFAAEAMNYYRRVGAFNEAAAIDDFRRKMLWLASRGTTEERPSSNL